MFVSESLGDEIERGGFDFDIAQVGELETKGLLKNADAQAFGDDFQLDQHDAQGMGRGLLRFSCGVQLSGSDDVLADENIAQGGGRIRDGHIWNDSSLNYTQLHHIQ